MIPLQKAKALYNYYDDLLNKDFKNPIVNDNQLKECVLIFVNEMINELTKEISPSIHGFRHKYWQEVKQEIEKL